MIGDRIKFFQELKQLSSKELARKADISPTYLSYVINDKRKNPSLPVLERIASVLEVPVEEFFKDEKLGMAVDAINSIAKLAKDGLEYAHLKPANEMISYDNSNILCSDCHKLISKIETEKITHEEEEEVIRFIDFVISKRSQRGERYGL